MGVFFCVLTSGFSARSFRMPTGGLSPKWPKIWRGTNDADGCYGGGCRNAHPSGPQPMKPPKYRLGNTSRITVTCVREDACSITTDTPENLLKFWQEIIATQPDHEPDKESVVVVMMNTRLRPYAWHRVSLGTVSESHCLPREIFRPVIVSAAYGFALMHNHPSGVMPHPDLCRMDVNSLSFSRGKRISDTA